MGAFTVPTIFTAIDKFNVPVGKMKKNLSSFEQKAAKLQRRFRKISEQSKKIAIGAGIVGTAILAPLGIAAKAASDFEAKMSNVATLVDINKESMSDMSKEVLKLSTKLPVALDDLTTSLFDIRSAGIPATQAMNTLEQSARLGVAGLGSASEATNIMTSAMNAFASEGLKAEEIADLLFKTTKAGKTTIAELAVGFGANAAIIESAGVKLADFQAATAALTTVGIPAAQAQIQLKASISALQKPTAEMTRIFKGLGVTSEKDLIQKFGSLGGAFEAVNKKGTKMGANLAKAWSSVQAGAAVTSITGATQEAYINTLDDMVNSSNAVNEAFEKQMETTAAQSQVAKNNMQALSVTVGTVLLPIINKLFKTISPLMQKFTKWIDDNPVLFSTIIRVVAAIGVLLIIVSSLSSAIVALNVIMVFSLSTIGLIIIGVVLLIGLIAVIIAKYDKWGASLTFLLGPLGLLINQIQSFRRNWDMIVEAFEKGGFLAGIKAIGVAILDSMLMPIQQLLELISKVPGLDFVGGGAESIQNLRERMGANTGKTPGLGIESELVNPKLIEQQSLTKKLEKTTTGNLNVNVKSNNNNTTIEAENIPKEVSITSTVDINQG